MTVERVPRYAHEDELVSERGFNEEYVRFLKAAVAKNPAREVSSSRNSVWTGSSPGVALSAEIVQPLIGRVSLGEEDQDLGRSFYVGSRYSDFGGTVVVSWVARKASLFYASGAESTLCDGRVDARRSFVPDELDIEDFVDDVEPGVDPLDTFVPIGARALAVPTAPKASRPARTTVADSSAADGPHAGDAIADDAVTSTRPPRPPVSASEVTVRAELRAEQVTAPLRAEGAVHRLLERPRTGHLTSVLSTLQPDQYELVTWPTDRLLVVQGQPGTGKTVIATHRAAYLTHPSSEVRRLKRVLIVGPTDHYRSHVRQAIDDLGARGVAVESLPSLMRSFPGVTEEQVPEMDQRLDTAWALGSLVDQAVVRMLAAGRFTGSPDRDLRILVKALVTDSDVHREVTLGSSVRRDLSRWLLGVKSFDAALRHAYALPFLASAALATRRLSTADMYQHILIDEAQDVRPLEWRILSKLLDAGATMSVFGDMNQRRSDWSYPSWSTLVDELDLVPVGDEFSYETLTVGYRSTRQILRFANQLLPADERLVHAIRDGVEPIVEKVRPFVLVKRTVEIAEELASKHSEGLVAVIAADPVDISNRLRRLGWTQGRLLRSWVDGDRTIVPLKPVEARGLEYDAVVVVEPEKFPKNLGRDGLLYTSLTRATKELVVLHSDRLPKRLRVPA